MQAAMKAVIKRVLPRPAVRALAVVRDELRSLPDRLMGVPRAPYGTDLVGYEVLARFIRDHGVLEVEGDVVEIGTFLGGGAYKLSKFLDRSGSVKKLFVVDIFDPSFDWTPNAEGNPMAMIYADALRVYHGKSQWEVFQEITRTCGNIVVLKGDSKGLEIPANRLCFGFIDGNHDPEYVESDFYLIWDKLVPGGGVAFHDYDWDLPQTTAKIDELVRRHATEIRLVQQCRASHVLFVIRGEGAEGKLRGGAEG